MTTTSTNMLGSPATVEFRARDYAAEGAAAALPRTPATSHPLAAAPPPPGGVAGVDADGVLEYDDPLRSGARVLGVSGSDAERLVGDGGGLAAGGSWQWASEWAAFKKSLMLRFPAPTGGRIESSTEIAARSGIERLGESLASMHLEDTVVENDKLVPKQDYVSQVKVLKEEIISAWNAGDHVKSLKLSIKVARLLLDTSALQFYPSRFFLVTDVLDMLGDLVWDRIKRKAEYYDEGDLMCHLPEIFKSTDVCNDAKETCYNWFSKIGSIHKLLPRIYLELSILRCWHFLQDNLRDHVQRLMLMMRGLADSLAFVYCHLYMIHCIQMLPSCDMGIITVSIHEITSKLTPIASSETSSYGAYQEISKMFFTIVEPSIGWIIKSACSCPLQVDIMCVELGIKQSPLELPDSSMCLSVILYHLLKVLPVEIISMNGLAILQLVEKSVDKSHDQYQNYKQLGLRLCESIPSMDMVGNLLDKISKVIVAVDDLRKYLSVVDSYLDIVLMCQKVNYLAFIMDGISKRSSLKFPNEDELESLQSILIKILDHFISLEDAIALDHFIEILNLMRGNSRKAVNIHILRKATRNGYVREPVTAQFLFDVSKALHDDVDSLLTNNDQRPEQLISHFVALVDFEADLEHQLTFLVNCRAAFSGFDKLKRTIVHSCNYLAIRAMRNEEKLMGFIKSCIAFNEATIPSVSSIISQVNLYLETAEVALQGGLISHTDTLVDSIFSSLDTMDLNDNSRMQFDNGRICSLLEKFCSFLIVVPGNFQRGIMHTPKNLLSLVCEQQGGMAEFKLRTYLALSLLTAALSQRKLPYHVQSKCVFTNDNLFFGNPTFYSDILSFSSSILPSINSCIQQETNAATRGRLALQACNCIMSTFKASRETSSQCTELIKIAKNSLHPNKYLRSTIELLEKYSSHIAGETLAGVDTLARESATSFPLH